MAVRGPIRALSAPSAFFVSGFGLMRGLHEYANELRLAKTRMSEQGDDLRRGSSDRDGRAGRWLAKRLACVERDAIGRSPMAWKLSGAGLVALMARAF